jgi:hypothetical protein
MSNLIKDLIPLLGKTQKINNIDVEDERVKLFLWMMSDDIGKRNNYFLHGNNSTWDMSTAKNQYYASQGFGRNIDTQRDVEIDLLIQDISIRVASISQNDVKAALNNLANKKLDYTANSIVKALFKNINNNLVTDTIPSPVNSFTLYDQNTIANNLFTALQAKGAILFDFNNKEGVAFTTEYHNRRPLAFSYKIDEYLARRILQDQATANVSVGSTFLTDLDSKLAEPTHEFYRKPEDLSKLWTKENGVEVEVDRNSQRMRDVTKNPANCYGHSVNNDGNETCHKYLEECLNGNGIDKCRDFMKNPRFWGNKDGSAKTEVNGMLPATALATLEKFGFRQVSVFDTIAKRNIYKVETVSSWLEVLSKRIAEPDYSSIKGNENLIKYLTLLEVKINASPEILNKGITSSDGTQSFNPNKFAGQFASQAGIKAKLPTTSIAGLHKRLTHTLNTSGIIGLPKFVIPIALNMRGGNDMVGGDVSDYVSNMLLDDNKDTKFVAFEYENMYNSYKNALKGMNKTIDPVDDKELQKLITSFKNTEKKAFVSLRLIKKYMELMDIFKYNDPNQVLTLSNLDLLVSTNKSQLDKGVKKQENLTNALNTLASVVENAVNGVKPTTAVQGSYNGSSFSHDN